MDERECCELIDIILRFREIAKYAETKENQDIAMIAARAIAIVAVEFGGAKITLDGSEK